MARTAPTAEDTIQHLREHLGAWYLAINPTYKWVDYQQERIVPALERLERRDGKRKLAVFMPPGFAKSDIGTRAFIPWYLGRHPEHSAMTLAYGDDLAIGFGRNIKNTCNSRLGQAVFPGLELTKDSRGNKHFATVQGNEYWAAGFDSSVSGRRLNLLAIDDPVKNKREAESETEMTSRFDIYRSVADHRLRPDGIVAMFLHRFALTDFAARVLQHEGSEWDVLQIPCENEDGTYLWQDHFGRERFDQIKLKDPEIWWAMYMQQPRAFAQHYFSDTWLNFYEPKDIKKSWATYMICDPGLSQKRSADRTSIIVLAAGPERRLFVVDWVMDRLDPDQRADAIVRLVRKHRPRRFIYEEFGLVSDTFYLNKRFKKEGISIRPIAVGRKGPRALQSKESRIAELRSDFREALIWLPKTWAYRCVDGSLIDVIRLFIDEEYIPYRGAGSVPHDDGLDSLSRIHEPELRIEYVPEPDANPRRMTERKGGWEAYW